MNDRPTLLWFAYDHSMVGPGMQLASLRDSVVVVNPNSGPGEEVDEIYEACARHKRWSEVYGYVDALTQEDKPRRKKRAELEAEVKAYRDMYGIKHIWLDDVALFIRDKQAPVIRLACDSMIYNPGQRVPKNHPLAKEPLVCDFEDPINTKNQSVWGETGCAVRVVFSNGNDIPSIEKEALHSGVELLGFEDLSRHHNGEYQIPMRWINKLQ